MQTATVLPLDLDNKTNVMCHLFAAGRNRNWSSCDLDSGQTLNVDRKLNIGCHAAVLRWINHLHDSCVNQALCRYQALSASFLSIVQVEVGASV